MNRRKARGMSQTVTFGELENLKSWIVERFATKADLAGVKSSLEDKMMTGFDKIWGALQDLKQEVTLIHGAVLRIEGK